MTGSVDRAVARAALLPTPTQLAVQVLELVGRPDSDATQILEIVRRDPATTLRLIQIANRRHPERNHAGAEDAIATIGLPATRVVSLGFTLAQPAALPFDLVAYARDAHASSFIARALSQHLEVGTPSAMATAGLLGNLGHAACALSEEAEGLDSPHGPLVTHEILRRAGLPPSVVEAVGRSHDPRTNDASLKTPASILAVARRLGAMCAGDKLEPSELRSAARDLRALGGGDIDRAEALFEALQLGVRRDSRLFASDAANEETLRHMRQVSSQLLLRITLGTTADLGRTEQRAARAKERASALAKDHQRLVAMATTDGLTGLCNRFELDRRLDQAVDSSRTNGRSLGLLMLDLDHFKQTNDTHGHAMGDEVLRRVGESLSGSLRDGELIARYGGEEFTVVVQDVSPEELQERAEEIRAAVADLRFALPGGGILTTSTSIGATWTPGGDPDLDAEAIRTAADSLLYDSKREGRNRVTYAPLASPAIPA